MKSIGYKNYFWTFLQLFRSDFVLFKQMFFDKIVDQLIYVTIILYIFAVVLPGFGVSADYSLIVATGLIGTVLAMELFPGIVNLLSDYFGNRVIHYYLTLPLPAYLVIIRMICFYAFSSITTGIFALPMCKLLLWNQFSLAKALQLKFILFFALCGMFYGSFMFLLSTMIKNMSRLSHVWMRTIFPLWFLGGFQFTWFNLHATVPIFSYIDLLNPYLYALEGTRAILLGQEGYIPLWICVIMLSLFSLICTIIGFKRLKKKLDFV